jgi:hypothetical protein
MCISPITLAIILIRNAGAWAINEMFKTKIKYADTISETQQESSATWPKISNWWLTISFGWTVIIALTASNNNMEYFHSHTGRGQGWDLCCFGFLFISGFYIFIEYYEAGSSRYKNIILIMIMAFIVTTAYSAITDARNTIHNFSKNKVEITFKNGDTASTDSNYYYIGRTNRYVFFSDSSGENVSLLPQDDIKKIEFENSKVIIKPNEKPNQIK